MCGCDCCISSKSMHSYLLTWSNSRLRHLKDRSHNAHGVPQERRRTVNPLRGKREFLANETVKVNPNGGKQGEIPKKESPGIANNKSDPNGCQKELVPRRPWGNSNKNPSGSNSAVQAETKGDPRRVNPIWILCPSTIRASTKRK